MPLTIDLDLDSKGVKKGLRGVQGTLKKTSQRFNAMSKELALGAAASAAAIAGIGYAALRLVETYGVQEQAERRLGVALKNSGNAANFSLGEMKKYASSLQELTTFGDEAILSAQAMLLGISGPLTQQNIKGVTEAMLDMSTAMGIDLKQSAQTLGIVLGNPSEGLTRLRRNGVDFTESQKEMIKQLVKSGKKSEAHGFILDALSKKFGGQAKAAAKDTGAIKQMKNTFGDLAEVIGKELSPLVIQMSKNFKAFAEILQGEGGISDWAKYVKMNLEKVAAYYNNYLEKAEGHQSTRENLHRRFGVEIKATKGTSKKDLENRKKYGDQLKNQLAKTIKDIEDAYVESISVTTKGEEELDKAKTGGGSSSPDETTTIEKTKLEKQEIRNIESEHIKLLKEMGLESSNEKEKKRVEEREAILENQRLTDEQLAEVVREGLETKDEVAIEQAGKAAELLKKRKQDNEKFEEGRTKSRKKRQRETLNETSKFLGNLSSLMYTSNRKQFELGKAAAIANALVSTSAAAIDAFEGTEKLAKPLGPFALPLAIAAAVAAAAAGMVHVNTIRSQKMQKAKFGGIVGQMVGTPLSGDHQPMMLEAGEMIVPGKDVEMNRKANKLIVENSEGRDNFFAEDQRTNIDISFVDDASSLIRANLIEDRALGIGVT